MFVHTGSVTTGADDIGALSTGIAAASVAGADLTASCSVCALDAPESIAGI